jgi:hypothetical protein
VALDPDGGALTSTAPTGDAGAWRPSGALAFESSWSSVSDLACPAATRCVAVTNHHAHTTGDPLAGGWTETKVVDDNTFLTGVECPTAELCVALTSGGAAIVGRPGEGVAVSLSARLRAQLTATGRAARIGTVLRRRGFALPFTAPAAGTVRVRWLHRSPKRRSLVATGAATFAAGGGALVRLKLSTAGRRLLRRHTRLRLTAQATLRPADGAPAVTVNRAIRLRR